MRRRRYLAKRRHRSEDGFFKRHSAGLFYKLLRQISATRIEENVGDFRLLDRKVVEVLKDMPEQQIIGYRPSPACFEVADGVKTRCSVRRDPACAALLFGKTFCAQALCA